MTGDQDRDPLEGLALEATPSPELEQRVVAALRTRGLLRDRRPRAAWAALAAGLVGALAGWLARAPSASVGAPAAEEAGLYLLLLWPSPDDPEADAPQRVFEYGEWARRLREERHLVRAEKLGDDGRLLGDGVPVAPAPLEPGGFFLIRAANLEEAVGVARGCPHLRYGGRVSVRPVDPT